MYTLNRYGLRDKDMGYMYRIFTEIPAIEKVILYGSRATGKFEKGSDVDLAVVGDNLTFSDIAHVHSQLEEESPTLLWFDVLNFNRLKNMKLRGQIKRYGVVIYERKF